MHVLLKKHWFILEFHVQNVLQFKKYCLLNQNKHTVLTTEKAISIFPNLSMKSHKYKISKQQFELVEETLQSNKSGPRYQPLTCPPSFTKVMKTLSPLQLWFSQLSTFLFTFLCIAFRRTEKNVHIFGDPSRIFFKAY